jgi:hypothetical protein
MLIKNCAVFFILHTMFVLLSKYLEVMNHLCNIYILFYFLIFSTSFCHKYSYFLLVFYKKIVNETQLNDNFENSSWHIEQYANVKDKTNWHKKLKPFFSSWSSVALV